MSKATSKRLMQNNQNDNKGLLIKIQMQITNHTDSIKAKK